MPLDGVQAPGVQPSWINDLIEELDAGLFVLGELQAGLADTAYMAVEEMATLLTDQDGGVESEATGGDKPNG